MCNRSMGEAPREDRGGRDMVRLEESPASPGGGVRHIMREKQGIPGLGYRAVQAEGAC